MERQTDDELATPIEPLAARCHRPAVQFHEAFHQRQPNADSAVGVLVSGIDLREHFEYLQQHRRCNADAVVAHADDDVRVLQQRMQFDQSARRRILGGIGQKVGNHLGEPHRVDIELDGSLRQFYEQLKAHLKQQHNGHHQNAEFSLREIRQALKLSKTQLFRYANDLAQLEYIRPSGGHANKGYTYQVTYWDNYQSLRERIRRSLDEQVKALKVGAPAAETVESETLRNATGTLEPA